MFRPLLGVFIAALVFAESASAALLYGVAAYTGDVYVIDTANPGNFTQAFSLGAGKDFAGLTYSNRTRTYYAYSRAENKVYEFDTTGNVLGVIAIDIPLTQGFGGPRGITFDKQGRLYVVGFNNDVYQVIQSTGKTKFAFRATGSTNEVEALAPLNNSTMYAVGVRSQVFTLDRKSGQLTNIASLPVGDLDSLTATLSGWLFMSESGATSRLHAYNPSTSTFQSFGSLSIPHLSSLQEIMPVPAPAAFLLFLTGVVALRRSVRNQIRLQ